jgi:hypothetical protein
VLLGQLIEKVSGEPYASFVGKNIFAPLGMKDSGYDWNADIVPKRAAGYARVRNGLENAGFIHMSIPHAAGALYSTTGDLLRWQRGLYEGKVISAAALQSMTTPYLADYGYGLGIRQAAGGKEFGHGGGIEGFATQMQYRPAEKISVIVLSNIENSQFGPMVGSLTAIARGETVVLPSERREVTLSPTDIAGLPGTYAMPDGRRLHLRERNGQLMARLDGQRALPVLAEARDRFFGRVVDVQLEVQRDASGRPGTVILRQAGESTKLQRVADAATDYDATAIYLRGDMNQWSVRDPLRKTGKGVYQAVLELAPGSYGFKVGSDDFRAVDLGAAQDEQLATPGAPQALEAVGPNMTVEINKQGRYTFTLNVSKPDWPVLTVSGP